MHVYAAKLFQFALGSNWIEIAGKGKDNPITCKGLRFLLPATFKKAGNLTVAPISSPSLIYPRRS